MPARSIHRRFETLTILPTFAALTTLGTGAAVGIRASATVIAQELTTKPEVTAKQDITTKDIAAGLENGARWLSYSGDYAGRRFSPLAQITAANVGLLSAQWTFQTGVANKFEATPIVIDGRLYITGPLNHAWAIDGRTGRQIWHYQRSLPAGLRVCCGLVNRGFAAYGDRLFLATLDAHLVALEMKTGKIIFDIEMEKPDRGFAGTGAPLVVKDKLMVGIAGGEYANRGFLDAYDPMTGTRLWRWYSIPAPGESGSETWPVDLLARGGGPTWLTGAYDPALNLLYWGTGNPNPDWDGESRPGDNLYTASLVALDPDTGALRWHYQFTPHDTHDWDANEIPVLADLAINGQPRQVVMMANRNGFFYVLDRANGSLIVAEPYANTTWANEIGKDSRPVQLPGHDPTPEGTETCPDWYGATNFMSPSFDAANRTFFVTVRETCAKFIRRPPATDISIGDRAMGGTVAPVAGYKAWGALRAIDPVSVGKKWEIRYEGAGWAGVLATAGGVVFSGDHDGNFFAADSGTGEKLFQYQTGSTIFAAPTTYMIGDRQYVLMPSGANVTAFALPRKPGNP
jgi:alcohol dehydrogenase (cytochrome c)